MNAILERIRNEAKALSLEQRETLVAALDYDLRGSNLHDDSEDQSDVEAAWDAEIKQRVDQIQSGEVTLLGYEDFMSVFDEARAEIKSRKGS